MKLISTNGAVLVATAAALAGPGLLVCSAKKHKMSRSAGPPLEEDEDGARSGRRTGSRRRHTLAYDVELVLAEGGNYVDGNGSSSSSSSSSKSGKGGGKQADNKCACAGAIFYMRLDAPTKSEWTWVDAFEATPQNCVLSSVSSQDEFETVAELASRGQEPPQKSCWVGLYYGTNHADNGSNEVTTEQWWNPNGSNVPADFWYPGEPSGFGSRAAFTSDDEVVGLSSKDIDFDDADLFEDADSEPCAVYKCCLYKCFE